MGRKFKIRDSARLSFITFTVVEWIKIFNKEEYTSILLDSIRYCQKTKGLEVYSWVFMPNHIHMIVGRNSKLSLSSIIRDLKS